MINYRSNTGRTVATRQYQVTTNPGVDLYTEDAELEALVVAGTLVKNGGTQVTAPKSASVVSTPTGTSK